MSTIDLNELASFITQAQKLQDIVYAMSCPAPMSAIRQGANEYPLHC